MPKFLKSFSFFMKYEIPKIKIKKLSKAIKPVLLTPRASDKEREEKYKLFLKNSAIEQIKSEPTNISVCMLGIWIITADREEKRKIAQSLFLYEILNFDKMLKFDKIAKI